MKRYKNVHQAMKDKQFNWEPPTKKKPPARTDAMPGTAEKIKVMRQRLERGEAIFSDEDRRTFD